MKNSKNILAIIMPCWNSEPYIGAMLDCFERQTYKDWNLFCVDDLSTDNTADIIRRFAEKDERIVYIPRYREPKGAQTCRNIGFDMTKGYKYVMFFDSDDLISPLCFQQRVEYMEKHPNLDFAVFPALRIYNEPFDCREELWGYDYLNDSLKCFLTRSLMMVGWTNIYRRESLAKSGLKWDEKVLSLQDADWNIQAILAGLKYEYASKEGAKVDYFYRIVPSGIARKIRTTPHFESHVYHINKTLCSLSQEQLKKYSIDIQGCILKFARLLMADRVAFLHLLSIEWFQHHRWMKWRLLFSYFVLGGRGSAHFLFPNISKYHNQIWANWKTYQQHWIEIIMQKEKIVYDV